ncbi:lysylphosphatidylglycerol synthase transmembrane domain-containing protein [Desulfatirhabdium butyrativorans]|uniref:lysylphosphatidylglycerol synthase transmembrane domain-containing protein n=1 Tax=Desulfatirhabdium butyrativorans TaxID=340467 RepID=UPI0012EC6655|nr:lysylphosphatidylglycerol synthase transmembrane domain-containing protein [Desulfatirhabdium butyrativorans]
MKRYLKSLLQMIISMAILGALVFWMDREKAKWLLHEARFGYLVLTFLLCLADRFLMGFKFRFLLRAISIRITQVEMFRIYYICSLQGLVIPFGVGPDLLKYWRIRKLGVPHADLVAAILMERFLGMAATACLILGSIALLVLRLSRAVSSYLVVFFLVIAAGVSGIAGLAFSTPFRNRLFQVFRIRRLSTMGRIEPYYQAFARFRGNERIIAGFWGLSFLEQFIPVLVIFFVARALSVGVSFTDCLAVIPITTFVERLPLSFDGIGVREMSNVFLFGLIHIDYDTSLTFSLVAYGVFLASLAPAALWAFFEPLRPEPVVENSPPGGPV